MSPQGIGSFGFIYRAVIVPPSTTGIVPGGLAGWMEVTGIKIRKFTPVLVLNFRSLTLTPELRGVP
jgi:hypothetical protein